MKKIVYDNGMFWVEYDSHSGLYSVNGNDGNEWNFTPYKDEAIRMADEYMIEVRA